MTSLRVLVHEIENIFEYVFWTVNHLDMKLVQVVDIVMGNILEKILHGLEDWIRNWDPFYYTNLL